MTLLGEIKESLLQIVFPHVCDGCGTDVLDTGTRLCITCLSSLPETNFHMHANNPVEKTFWGRIPVTAAMSQYYFTKESLIQRLMHQFKYRQNKALGLQLGRGMGLSLKETSRFSDIDALIPLPLFPAREKKRGYNQAAVLCEGIQSVLPWPILNNAVSRPDRTETQTRKGRIERWKNIEGRFKLEKDPFIRGKHILLVDDVVTTGATLEACATELLEHGNCRISIATLCYTAH